MAAFWSVNLSTSVDL